ncbi:MAG: NFACT family protein, partial [Treponema porcinum]|nr:NFACT family protein [Treponema porcinum]
MSLNCNEINVVLSELNLEGSFIQDVVQPGYDTVALYTYGKDGARTILICTSQNSCRIHETRRKIVKNDKPLRFMECLKARIKGTRIDSCCQIGLQRIVQIELSHGAERFVLYVRLWSNAANVILCDENNVVVDSLYRRPAKGEVTGGLFTVPEEKPSENRVWQVRTFDDVQAEYSSRFPEGGTLSFNQKIDIWYGEHAETLSREALLVQAEKWYSSSKARMESALERLLKKQNDFSQAEQLRHQGDLILSNIHLIAPKAKFLECDDYETGRTVRILLNPEKSANENAAA